VKAREVEALRDILRLKLARGEKISRRERRVLDYAPLGLHKNTL
jgi:hypothetical protein